MHLFTVKTHSGNIIVLSTIILLSFLVTGCNRSGKESIKHTFYRMDTVFDITAVRNKSSWFSLPASVKRLLSASGLLTDNMIAEDTLWRRCDSLLADWEVRYSQTSPNSEVYKLNNMQTRFRPASPRLLDMIELGLRYGDSLGGMFDITIYPLKLAWGFDERSTTQVVPERKRLVDILSHVGYGKIKVDRSRSGVEFMDTCTQVDLGGVGKKYVMNILDSLLQAMHFTDFLISAGGDLTGRGKRPDGKPWRIGIQHPRKPDGTLCAMFNLDSGVVVTSGDYERYFFVDGVRYHHIFNPKTGYPATANQSLTIWGPDLASVNVLSTGLFCLTADSILSYIQKRPPLECMVIDSTGNTRISAGWKDKITMITQQ